MTTRAKSRFKPFPMIQDNLTPLFENHSTNREFERLTETQDEIRVVQRDLKEISKQEVGIYRRDLVALLILHSGCSELDLQKSKISPVRSGQLMVPPQYWH